ncbi:unnamed protein product, partial [Phaeothamnion confervicola]
MCGFWLLTTGGTFLTKVLLTEPALSIPAPVLITWTQCLVSWLFLEMLAAIGVRRPKGLLGEFASIRRLPQVGRSWGPWVAQDDGGDAAGVSDLARLKLASSPGAPRHEVPPCGGTMLTASVCFAGVVLLDNMCLQHVNVSFFSVARGLSLPLVSAAGYFLAGARPRWDLGMPILMCLCGFSFGSRAQPAERFTGTVYGALASVMLALYAVALEPVSRGPPGAPGRLDVWQLTLLTNRNAAWLLLPAVALLEAPLITAHAAAAVTPQFWGAVLAGALLSVSAAVLAVAHARCCESPGVWVASVTAQRAAQHGLAFLVWGNSPRIFGEIGTALVLGAFAVY